MCDGNVGRFVRPAQEFRYVIRHAGDDRATANLAAAEPDTLRRRRGGVLIEYWHKWRAAWD
jgi:hypothetical protein